MLHFCGFTVIIISEIEISYCTLKIEYFRNKYEKRKTMKIATLNVGHQNYQKILDKDGKIDYLKRTKNDTNYILTHAIEDTISIIKETFHSLSKIDILSLTEIYVAVAQNNNFRLELKNLGLACFLPKCNHCFQTNGKDSTSVQLSTCIIVKEELARDFQAIDATIMPNIFPVFNRKEKSYNSCTARECRISNNEFEIISLYIPSGMSTQKFTSVKSLEKLLSEMKNNFANGNGKRYIYLGDFNFIIPNFEDRKQLEDYKVNFPRPYFFFKELLKEYNKIQKTNDTWAEDRLGSTYGTEKIDYIFSSQFKATKSSVHSINPKTFINKHQQEIQIIDHKLLLTEIEY